jgi:hypothetical protein
MANQTTPGVEPEVKLPEGPVCAVCREPLKAKTRKTRVFASGLEGLICGKPNCARAGAIPRPDIMSCPTPEPHKRPRCPAGRRQRKSKR